MRSIEFEKNVKPRQPVFLDRLDQILNEKIYEHKSISLSDLQGEYLDELGQIPYSTLHYRVSSLAQEGYIRLERNRRALMCISLGD